jgi:hypothetical protein
MICHNHNLSQPLHNEKSSFTFVYIILHYRGIRYFICSRGSTKANSLRKQGADDASCHRKDAKTLCSQHSWPLTFLTWPVCGWQDKDSEPWPPSGWLLWIVHSPTASWPLSKLGSRVCLFSYSTFHLLTFSFLDCTFCHQFCWCFYFVA